MEGIKFTTGVTIQLMIKFTPRLTVVSATSLLAVFCIFGGLYFYHHHPSPKDTSFSKNSPSNKVDQLYQAGSNTLKSNISVSFRKASNVKSFLFGSTARTVTSCLAISAIVLGLAAAVAVCALYKAMKQDDDGDLYFSHMKNDLESKLSSEGTKQPGSEDGADTSQPGSTDVTHKKMDLAGVGWTLLGVFFAFLLFCGVFYFVVRDCLTPSNK